MGEPRVNTGAKDSKSRKDDWATQQYTCHYTRTHLSIRASSKLLSAYLLSLCLVNPHFKGNSK